MSCSFCTASSSSALPGAVRPSSARNSASRSGVGVGASAGTVGTSVTTVAPSRSPRSVCRPVGHRAGLRLVPTAGQRAPGPGRHAGGTGRRHPRRRAKVTSAPPAVRSRSRATSLSAVAIRTWSWCSRPTAAATSRPRCRTTKMSCSTRSAICSSGSAPAPGHAQDLATRTQASSRRTPASRSRVAAITSGDRSARPG